MACFYYIIVLREKFRSPYGTFLLVLRCPSWKLRVALPGYGIIFIFYFLLHHCSSWKIRVTFSLVLHFPSWEIQVALPEYRTFFFFFFFFFSTSLSLVKNSGLLTWEWHAFITPLSLARNSGCLTSVWRFFSFLLHCPSWKIRVRLPGYDTLYIHTYIYIKHLDIWVPASTSPETTRR